MKTVKNIGLCEGRHTMPVEGYIFPQVIENPFDYTILDGMVEQWVEINSDVTSINLYVTGLTVCLIEVIKVLQAHSVKVTLMHFDRNTNDYISQEV